MASTLTERYKRLVCDRSRERAAHLTPGEKLRVMIEVNNPATRLAVTLHADDYVMVGWAPRYLVEDLVACIPKAPEIEVTVVKVNHLHAPPEPIHFGGIHGKDSRKPLSHVFSGFHAADRLVLELT